MKTGTPNPLSSPAPALSSLPRGNQGEKRATSRMRMAPGSADGGPALPEVSRSPAVRFPQGADAVWRSERLGRACDSSSLEGSALAWPTYHRLPDEVVHEVPSEQFPSRRSREGWVFHRDRLSDRSRSAVAVAKEGAARTPPS